ncbi:pectin lyase fold/virulence factor [Fusarium redolens]|uniref:Pectin lyase fold/virulence factor n=1 Tax=Fusarium redolens TaxID=48865 RepID=A0A9P9HPV1_FUSRE|nr:pectin lyase fold/virulence factor [Fusarium redolens]KAH7261141.1 pectin lyase fold/virulence factor [Fusarium redolens]
MKFTLLLALTASSVAQAAQLAFPGAEGFGSDSGKGSLRDAVSKPNRIVVFDVGGVIKISERIVVSKNIYIAGQTAPGGGIVVYGNGWSLSNANDSIVRYITIRMGKGGTSGKDAIGIADGKNIIFDHVSVSWGRDETFSINGDVTNVTIQNTIIAQGLVSHSCGGLMQTDGGVSLFRNLYIDNKTRNPKVKGVNDFQNNVVYNWGGGGGYIAGDSQADSYANIINNYFISGPDTTVTAFTRGNSYFHAYVKDNFYDSNRNGKLDGAALCEKTSCYSDIDFVKTPYNYPAPDALSPQAAVEFVLKGVGNSLHRDSVDTALINQVKSYGTKGGLISDEKEFGGVGEIANGAALKDSDGDGIPDEWETKNGLNPNDASDDLFLALQCVGASCSALRPPIERRATTEIPSDSFNSLETYWNYLYPWGPTHNGGARMDEEHVSVTDGVLTLTAEPRDDQEDPIHYLSGAIHAKSTFTVSPGGGYDISAEFIAPVDRGTWPAFWLNAASGWPPEIDIAEWKGSGKISFNTFNTSDEVTALDRDYPNPEEWHSVRAELRDENGHDVRVKFFLDGVEQTTQYGRDYIGAGLRLIVNYQTEGSSGSPGPTTLRNVEVISLN